MAVPASSRTWSRQGDQRSLATRWAEGSERLRALGGIVAWPMTETCYDDMLAEIERLSPTSRPTDPAARQARAELDDVSHRYWRVADDIIKLQKQLARLVGSPDHALLADITPDLLQRPPETNQMLRELFPHQPAAERSPYGVRTPEFPSVSGYRQASVAVTREVQVLEGYLARINEVLAYESMPRDQQCKVLIHALAARHLAATERIGERLARLEVLIAARPQPTKRRSK